MRLLERQPRSHRPEPGATQLHPGLPNGQITETLSSGYPGWAISAATDVDRDCPLPLILSHVQRGTWRSAEYFDHTGNQ